MEAAKKVPPLVAMTLRGGQGGVVGVKAGALRNKGFQKKDRACTSRFKIKN